MQEYIKFAIVKIAQFSGMETLEDRIKRVKEVSSFSAMKKNQTIYQLRNWHFKKYSVHEKGNRG